MPNDQKILNPIETAEPISNKKIESLVAFINTGIDVYNHYYCLNPEIRELGEQRRVLKNLLHTDLSIVDLENITSELSKIELSRYELEWHRNNANRLANDTMVDQLLNETISDCTHDMEKLLTQYQDSSSYVPHTAEALTELADELLPSLEAYVGVLIKRISKKSPQFSQIDLLQKQLQLEKERIAAAMALRIEAAFYHQNLNQDDVSVYMYHQLIKSSTLQHDAPLQIPQGLLTVELLSKFYTYIQDNGSKITKARLNGAINGDESDRSHALITSQLRNYIPVKRPWFGRGAKLRHDFFKQHSGLLMMVKSCGCWEEDDQPRSNVSWLSSMRHEIRQHQQELDTIYASMNGIKGLFLSKTKRFLARWEDILIKEEDRSWQRHYDSLTKHAEYYLRYPEKSRTSPDVLLEHLLIFMREINEFGPGFTKEFLSPLTQLKQKLDHQLLENEQLIRVLDNQIKESQELLGKDALQFFSTNDALSISSTEIERMEEVLDAYDDEDFNYQTNEMRESKRVTINSWANGIFALGKAEPPLDDERPSDDEQSSLSNKC